MEKIDRGNKKGHPLEIGVWAEIEKWFYKIAAKLDEIVGRINEQEEQETKYPGEFWINRIISRVLRRKVPFTGEIVISFFEGKLKGIEANGQEKEES